MSWWDTKTITALATSALKTAQEKIDKVLDIKEESDESNFMKAPIISTDDFFDQWIEKKEKNLTPESHNNIQHANESFPEKLISISSDKRTIDGKGTDANIVVPKVKQSRILLDPSLKAPKDPFNLIVSNISAFEHFNVNMETESNLNELQEVDINDDLKENLFNEESIVPSENNEFITKDIDVGNFAFENMRVESNFTLNSFLLNDSGVNTNINDLTEFANTECPIDLDKDIQLDSFKNSADNQYISADENLTLKLDTSKHPVDISEYTLNVLNLFPNKTITTQENLHTEQEYVNNRIMDTSLYNNKEFIEYFNFNKPELTNNSKMETVNLLVEESLNDNLTLIKKNEIELENKEPISIVTSINSNINLEKRLSPFSLSNKENVKGSSASLPLNLEYEIVNNLQVCLNKVNRSRQNSSGLKEVNSTGTLISTVKDESFHENRGLKETPSIINLASSSSTIKDDVSLEGSLIDAQEVVAEVAEENMQTDVLLIPSNIDNTITMMQQSNNLIEEDPVKNMIGEAMNDMQLQEEKNGSPEGSACLVSPIHNSGHTSADEIETTTSSDIEIVSHISTPSQNKHTNFSPRQRGIQNLHRRTDSGSSGQSLQSINSDDVVASTMFKSLNISHKGFIGDLSAKQLYIDKENLLKKLGEISEKLDNREKKLLTLSEENANLQDSNNIFRSQLEQIEAVRFDNDIGIRSMQDEFMQRITEMDKKNKSLLKERDSLKEALKEMDLHNRQKLHGFEVTLKEKEQIITELLEEGDKLSKLQLQTNSILKKLRTKEKDTEEVLKQLRQKNDNLNIQLENIKTQLKVKSEDEKKHIEIINQLNENFNKSKDEINKLTNDLEDSIEKARSFKVALDNSYKEIGELHRARLTETSEAQKIATNVELAANQRLRQLLDEHIVASQKNENQLLLQIEEMQIEFTRNEKDFKRKEALLKQEISDLQQRLQEAEDRNQELTQNVTTVTRPLIRQIENIQSSFSVHSNNFEKIERSLSERLYDSQAQLASAIEKERLMNENISELTNKIATFQTQNLSLKNEKRELLVQLEELKVVVENCEEKNNKNLLLKNVHLKKLEEDIKITKKEMIILESQLETEKLKSENDLKKYNLLKEQFNEKEMIIENLNTRCHSASIEEIRSNLTTPVNDQLILRSNNFMSQSYTSSDIQMHSKTSLYESMRYKSNNTSTFIEHLQSMLQLKSGELIQLQENISQLEKSRESMSKELVRQTIENEKLQQKHNETLPMQKQIYELNERYNALLQMYGEKVEVISELEMDIAELKEMYRLQLNELLELKSHSKLED